MPSESDIKPVEKKKPGRKRKVPPPKKPITREEREVIITFD